AEDVAAALDLGDQQRDAEAEDDLQGDHDHDQPEGVLQAGDQVREVEQDVVPVLQAHPDRRVELVVVVEGEVDRRDQRVGEEDAEAQQPGGQEAEGGQPLPAALSAQRRREAGPLPPPRQGEGGRCHPSRFRSLFRTVRTGRQLPLGRTPAAVSLSICASSEASAEDRFASVTWPASQVASQVWVVCWYWPPLGEAGVVEECAS